MKARGPWIAGLALLGLVGAAVALALRELGAPPEFDLAPEDAHAAAAKGHAPALRPRRPAGVPAGPPASDAAARASERNRAGIAALEAGDALRAVELFEQCLELDPDEPVFRANLAQALTRLALERRESPPCDGCKELLARAVELAPERDEFARLLERWRKEDAAQEGFWQDSSLHFDLSYDGSRRDLLGGYDRILRVLEDAYIDLGELFGAHPVEEGRPRIQVVLYRREQFGALTGLGDWAGGAFDGTVRVPVEDLAREEAALRRVLRHELVHAFVRAVGGASVPGWLNEGLAQWLEGGDRAFAVARARDRVTNRELFPLADLKGTLASWRDAESIARAYAQSLAFVDFLAQGYGERLLVEMVRACAEGSTPGEAFRRRTRLSLDAVLADLAATLQEG